LSCSWVVMVPELTGAPLQGENGEQVRVYRLYGTDPVHEETVCCAAEHRAHG